MIITIFLLIKELVEFARKYNLKKGNLHIDSIQSSTCTSANFTESMVVFMNCEPVYVSGAAFKSKLESFHCQECSCCLKKRKLLRRLNTINKMECEEDGHKDIINSIIAFKRNLISPASDCNSNNLTIPKENMFLCSTDSIQDCSELLQDNSEYQWCLDYGYKCNNSHHQSVLSLTKSQDIIYCDDMARNIDANLAEVDMDDFNREDIHSVLSSLPNMQGAEEREMFASVTGSMMVKFDFDSCFSPQSNSQEEQINTSICKSQLLFSPVRENYLPNSNLSVDSLDLSENDINLMVTCQSNKNNYTIAFEGSTVMTSDDLENRETCTVGGSKPEENRKTPVDVCDQASGENNSSNSREALVTSDSTFTTWSKIKESPSVNLRLRRHPSENNNSSAETFHFRDSNTNSMNFKSLSLPNLFRPRQKHNSGMSLSLKLSTEPTRNFSLSNDHRYVKLYDIQSNCKNNDTSRNQIHSFNLVKLFIKQKSASHEGMANYLPEQTVCNDNFKNNRNCQNIEKHWGSGRVSEINKLITQNCFLNNSENSVSAEKSSGVEGRIKTKPVDFKSGKKITGSSSYEKSGQEKKLTHNGYYSDESAQENGSNTESAENLTCDCINSPFQGNKKLTEKSIQTSKVLDSNAINDKKPSRVPVYILYPNYSLPNLEFLKKEHYVQNIDFSKVFLRPQKFQMPESPVGTPKAQAKYHGKRPFSVNDIETLKKTGFKHVKDWESLTFLLPKEYKQFLQEIPEIVAHLKDVKNSKEEMVPLFCLSPPPSRRVRKRTKISDINISNDSRNSNFSSTATQPSSGYRGSSTMLNSYNSCNANSPGNPSYSYKYDITSDSGFSRRSGSISQNKNYFGNSDDSNENCSQRPPLPKSILRNNSLDSHQYTCKTQKENANKRYSMVELTDKNLVLEEKFYKRRSLQNSNFKLSQGCASRVNAPKHSSGDSQLNSNKAMRNVVKNDVKSNLENDMKRLEELLEISAVFGESVESFTETDMMKLRSQVSKFLTMQKNLEKVSETLQIVDGEKTNGLNGIKSKNCEETHLLAVNNSQTPHNTPEHKKQLNNRNSNTSGLQIRDYLKPCNCTDQIHEFQEEDCKFRDENVGNLKKTVSFAEKISFAVKEHELFKERASNLAAASQKNNQVKAKRPVDLPICEESSEGVHSNSPTACLFQNSPDLLHKRDLVLDVGKASKKILKLCKESQEDPANICLHHLCPSLYAVLSDGLKEEIDTPFGPIRNSVWSVIEASSQQGPMTQTLNELVQRLNRDDIFTEGLIKFNAFIFGLLNSRALSGWLSYLRTRDGLLRKYYENSGLLLLSNTAGAPVRTLVDQLVSIIEPLGALDFNLDLMYQTKLLHCSLQNLNCLLEEPSNNDFLTPTKQFMLLKLVQSIQNSLSQSGEGKKSKHILEDIEEKTSDPPVGQLLEKNRNVRIRRGGSKTRPRSGCASVAPGPEKTDVASAMKKRWSGVNLNSKLTEAFDRLVDESESDYTDSLDAAAPRQEKKPVSSARNVQKEKNGNILTGDFEADKNTKEQKKNILLHLNKKSCKTESEKKELSENTSSKMQNSGQKFKRLQQKWERWEKSGRSPSDSDSDVQSPSLERIPSRKEKSFSTKTQKSEKTSCDINITMRSPTSRVSKIPRLVTSPLSSAPTTKPAGNVQKLVSPTSNDSNQRSGKANFARGSNCEGKFSSTEGNKLNRFEDKAEPISRGDSGKKQNLSKAALSQKKFNTTPVKKNDSVTKRASSMSLNKKPVVKKLHQAQRTVRTLTHRLPSDSGQLSFNEGERLKVVLEVDKAWLLCCRGNQKGLVPKSLVISDVQDKF